MQKNEIKRIYSFIGLAAKANKIVSGGELSEKAIKENKARLVIIAQDAADNTVNKFSELCQKKSITPIRFGYKEELGKTIGKAGSRSVVCITCKHFASGLRKMVGSMIFGGETFGEDKSI
ncbi:MAG: 50S ribosomal protein L7ae [Clostridiaceae bacterium]|nr:50S ribosomal protein L7ae [Clostridiaceae bacterium]